MWSIPACVIIAFLLVAVENVGSQLESPHPLLPVDELVGFGFYRDFWEKEKKEKKAKKKKKTETKNSVFSRLFFFSKTFQKTKTKQVGIAVGGVRDAGGSWWLDPEEREKEEESESEDEELGELGAGTLPLPLAPPLALNNNINTFPSPAKQETV